MEMNAGMSSRWIRAESKLDHKCIYQTYLDLSV